MMWAKMELATIMANQATLAAAGMETSVPFHAVVQGDLVGPEAVGLIADPEEVDRPREGEEARLDHQAGTLCCPLTQ